MPHGRTGRGDPATDDGAWTDPPADVLEAWATRPFRQGTLGEGFAEIVRLAPRLAKANSLHHLGTLGTGNHFIEVCLDESGRVWTMLHSGSRGIGNAIGQHFVTIAKQEAKRWHVELPDPHWPSCPKAPSPSSHI